MSGWWVGAAVAIAAVGCEPRVEPLLCVTDDASQFAGDDDIDDRRAQCDEATPTFDEGEVVHVLHQTDPEIVLEDDLEIVLTTPCDELRTTRRHAGGIARASVVLPPGGSCFLSVEATAAGLVLRRDYSGDCSGVRAHCPEALQTDGGSDVAPSDAGTDAGRDAAPSDDGG